MSRSPKANLHTRTAQNPTDRQEITFHSASSGRVSKAERPQTTTLVIIGAGQAGRLVAEIVRNRIPDLECIGFLDRDSSLHGQDFFGVPVLGGAELLESLVPTVDGALPVIGDLAARLRHFRRCRNLGLRLVNVIDPSVIVTSDLKLGEGIFVSFGSVILTHVEIADFCFIGTGVNILHDTTIGPNCVIGGGTNIGGSATVGGNVSFGVGVQVASAGIRIGL